MQEIIDNIVNTNSIVISATCCTIVFVAMMIDLAAGLYKAHLRGDARKSEALKRTGFKFCLYEGTMLIATGVDCMLYMAKLAELIGVPLLIDVPVMTIFIGIFWCVVEFLSVREKADSKIHSNISKAEKLAQSMLTREEWVSVLADAFRAAQGNSKKKTK